MADSDGDDGLMGNIVDLSASAVDDIEDSGAVPVYVPFPLTPCFFAPGSLFLQS